MVVSGINCFQQQTPGNGSLSCTEGSEFGSVCKFQCDVGFSLIGHDSVECGEAKLLSDVGLWTELNPPVCQRR